MNLGCVLTILKQNVSPLRAHQAITQKKKVSHKTLAEGHADCFFNNNGVMHLNLY